MNTVSQRMPQSGSSGNESAFGFLKSLHEIKFGSDPEKKLKPRDLVSFLSNLTTLVENGVSLPNALETLSRDRSLKKYRGIFSALSRSLKGGESLSYAMKRFPAAFNSTLISQVEVGERSGSLDQSLARITEQLERSSGHKKMILKKLSYPAILVVAGIGSVTFMLLFVIPTFQQMYEDAGAALPGITQFLIDASEFIHHYAVLIVIGGFLLASLAVFVVRNPRSRLWIDAHLIRVPVLGEWVRNVAVLQFAEILGNLMESGFTLAEALPPAGRAIGNHYVRERVLGLYASIRCGERFSHALELEQNLFPPVVHQLVIVGERTGRLVSVTKQIRNHLRKDVEDGTDAMVGAIEPVLTVSLAVAVGGILLAVYLPMFDLIGQVDQ